MVEDETLKPDRADGGHERANQAATQPGGTATPTQDTVVPVRYSLSETDFELVLPDHGYDLGGQLGRGGMGEVMAAHDRRIGRDVAIKRMTAKHPEQHAISRFLREARIQARLDHPAIVPVHELGIDPDGRPFFTMKRLAGITLGDKLKQGEQLRPLLHAFVDVCRAMSFAHERGVVHRDLKPSNIMLGDYGEVYVLDWGVARTLSEQDRATHGGDIDSLDDGTRTGAMLGTPGYMAPEQIRGEQVAAKADVYALGSILFEILVDEPLHPRGQAAIANTLSTPQHAPAIRKPERGIAPELDEACLDALAEVAARRPTVRELGDRVQRYLDGDRDLDRRRALASELIVAARAELTSDSSDAHARGIRLAGRALALDPESADAAALVTSSLLEPPKVLPADCLATIEREEMKTAMQRSKLGAAVTFSVFLLWALIPFLEIRDWTWVIAFYGIHAAVGAFLLYSSIKRHRGYLVVLLVSSLVASLAWSRIAGPFLLTPVMLCAAILGFTANPKILTRPWIPVVWAILGVMLPIILEWTGVLAPTTHIVDNTISVTSEMYEIRGNLELAALTIANLMFVVTVAFYAVRTNRIAYDIQRTQAIRNWQLDQIVPHAARS